MLVSSCCKLCKEFYKSYFTYFVITWELVTVNINLFGWKTTECTVLIKRCNLTYWFIRFLCNFLKCRYICLCIGPKISPWFNIYSNLWLTLNQQSSFKFNTNFAFLERILARTAGIFQRICCECMKHMFINSKSAILKIRKYY